jgi:amino acid adenylation domain-containing protein
MTRTVFELLTRAAREHPGRTAVVDGDRTIDYATLDGLSERVASLLIERGVEPGDRVAIYTPKSIEAVAAIYGVMKAGGVYVPFDPRAPASRLAYIARDAGIRVIVSSPALAPTCPELAERGAPLETILVTGGGLTDAPAPGLELVPWPAGVGGSTPSPKAVVGEDDLAYVLYTSGSTGDPKGVMLSHRNALDFVEWAADLVALTPADRVSSHAPFHFDLSTFDLYSSAAAAATVVLVPAEHSVFPIALARFIRDQHISVWYSVPSILTMLVLRGKLDEAAPVALRTVIFAGEVFPPKYLAALQQLLPEARFVNFYGPTETNVCTWYDVPRFSGEPPESIPIGVPLPCVEALVVDERGAPVERGAVGELVIKGSTVMHGYWGDPERTARVLDPGPPRAYRTGDLVRCTPDGNFVFLGRRDAQVKSRGYRIELGEIETAISAIDRVVECAVVAVPDDVVTNRIEAFVVPRDGLTTGDVLAVCKDRLPAYMIPEQMHIRAELPKSSTGKIDRRRLTEELEKSRVDR